MECSEIGFSLFICSCEVKRQHILAWDGVSAAKKGQNPPEGYYNLKKMLCDLVKASARVRACGTYLRREHWVKRIWLKASKLEQ